MVTFIFTFCVTLTITSFREIPLWVLAESKYGKVHGIDTDDVNIGTYEAINQMTCNSEVVSAYMYINIFHLQRLTALPRIV